MSKKFSIVVLIASMFFWTTSLAAQLSSYSEPTIYGRTGVTSFNMPNGSSLSSPTISIDDARNVALDVNFVGGSGNAGLFYASYLDGSVNGSIVSTVGDIIVGTPSQNGQQKTIYTVGFAADLFLFDAVAETVSPLNYPLGVTGASSLTFDAADRIGGRLSFGFDGDVYGVFPMQGSGFPPLEVYAADSGVDAGSPYSFLYSPDVSRTTSKSPPRIAAKVSTVAGFDFEEIRIFDEGGVSTLVAVETETDSMSPFSEFVTNSISISDDGTKIAFQANDVAGDSGIFLYDDTLQTISLIGSEAGSMINSIDFFSPDVNNDGLVVFRGDDSQSRSSVFVGDGSELIRLGGEGDLVMTDIGERQLGRRDEDFSQSGAPRINNNGDIGLIFQYFDPTNPNSVADGSLIMIAMANDDCLKGDLSMDGAVNLLDVAPFVDAIFNSVFSCEADVNGDGNFDLLDVAPFVELLTDN